MLLVHSLIAVALWCAPGAQSAMVSQAVTYQAEDGVLTGVMVANLTSGFQGTGYVTGFTSTNDSLAITIPSATYGIYSLSIRYASPYGDKQTNLLLNGAGAGGVTLSQSINFTSVSAGNLIFSAGNNTLTVEDGWGYFDIDSITIEPAPLPAATGLFQAEDGVLVGGVFVSNTSTGYSGTGYVTNFVSAGDAVSILVNAPKEAVYNLTLGYRSLYGEKKTDMSVNGVAAGEIDLPGAVNFTSTSAGEALLNEGSNIITFSQDWGYYDIDFIKIAVAPKPPPHHANHAPVDHKATKEAKALLKYIQKEYGNKILSGQQDPAAIEWLFQNVGKYPAIGGFDMMDYSPSRVAYGTVSTAVENATAWDAQGGITTFAWHWNAPTDLLNTAAEPWWSGFYTAATTFNVSEALSNPNGTDYALILRDLDAIAVELLRLQAANIPVLWRPLHESGEYSAFWWSAYGPGPVIALYNLMFERYTVHHGIHNLIWVWSSPESAYYPGNDVVDIVGYDSYPSEGDHGPVDSDYNTVIALVDNKRPVTLSEVGSIPDPTLLPLYHADWSYFVLWSGEYETDNEWNPLSFLREVYNSTHVVTLDTLGDFKH